jgi:hypothetical protein
MTDTDYIKANGNKYFYSEKLGIERYIVYERLAVQISTGMKAKEVIPVITECLKILRYGNDLLAAHFSAIEKLQALASETIKTFSPDHIHDMLMFCTLFLNREGEDTSEYNEELSKAKIRDWVKEGIDMVFFFRLCSALIPELLKRYRLDPVKDTLKNKALRDFLLKESAADSSSKSA